MAHEFRAGDVVLVDLSDGKEIVFWRKPSPEERGSDATIEVPMVMDAPSEAAGV